MQQRQQKTERSATAEKRFSGNMVLIPVYDIYESYVIRDNVHDTGFAYYSAGTMWTPADAWREK
jgi:hypothetical protein